MAADENGDTLEVLLSAADKLADSGMILEAEKAYTKLIEQAASGLGEKHPGRDKDLVSQLALAYNNRGQVRYLQVEFVLAVQDYTEAIRLKNDLTVAFYNRGQVHYRLSRFDEAMKDFKQTLRLDPKFEEAKVALNASIADKDEKERRQRGR